METHESILIGADVDEAAVLAAKWICDALTGGEGSKTIALSGGSTPEVLYHTLIQSPYRDQINWNQIEYFWSDERDVPPDHDDSNYRLANEHLLKPLRVSVERIHRMPADTDDISQAAGNYECLIRQIVAANNDGLPVFDLVLLGVGEDGHTASLFPGSTALAERDRLVVANEIPGAGIRRMTMTYPLLRAARQIVFLVTGPHKAEVLARIFSPDANPTELPAAGLRETAGQITWVLDAEAARLVISNKPA